MNDSNEELIEVKQQIVMTHIIQGKSQNSGQEPSQVRNSETGRITKKVGQKYMEELFYGLRQDGEFWREFNNLAFNDDTQRKRFVLKFDKKIHERRFRLSIQIKNRVLIQIKNRLGIII